MFLTAEHLLTHVVEQHSVHCWTCDYCTYASSKLHHNKMPAPKEVFTTAGDWTKHMDESHGDLIAPQNREVFAETHKRRLIDSLSCPFCEFQSDSWTPDIPDHILHHLHEFALRALPDDTAQLEDKISSRKTAGCESVLSHTQLADGGVDDLRYPDIKPQDLQNAISSFPSKQKPVVLAPATSDLAVNQVWQARASMLYAMAINTYEPEREQIVEFVTEEVTKDAVRLQSGAFYQPPPYHPGVGLRGKSPSKNTIRRCEMVELTLG